MTLVYLVQRRPAVVDGRLRERLNWTGGERFDDFLARRARTEQDRACRRRAETHPARRPSRTRPGSL